MFGELRPRETSSPAIQSKKALSALFRRILQCSSTLILGLVRRSESDSDFALLLIFNLELRVKDHELVGMTDKEPLEEGRWEEPIFPCDCDNVPRSDGGHEINTAQPA